MFEWKNNYKILECQGILMTRMKVEFQKNYKTKCIHEGGSFFETEAPKDPIGELFSPTDLVALSLASCVLTVMGMAADRLSVDLMGTIAEVEKEMISQPIRRIHRISIQVRLPCNPSDEIKEKLEKAALTCPVHQSLHPDIFQDIRFSWGGI